MLTIKSYRNIIGYKYKSGLQLDIFHIAEFDDVYLITIEFNRSIYAIFISRLYGFDLSRKTTSISITETSAGSKGTTMPSSISLEKLSNVDVFASAIVYLVISTIRPTPNII